MFAACFQVNFLCLQLMTDYPRKEETTGLGNTPPPQKKNISRSSVVLAASFLQTWAASQKDVAWRLGGLYDSHCSITCYLYEQKVQYARKYTTKRFGPAWFVLQFHHWPTLMYRSSWMHCSGHRQVSHPSWAYWVNRCRCLQSQVGYRRILNDFIRKEDVVSS